MKPTRVPAVARAADVLQTICNTRRPLGLAELTEQVGAPKTSVMGICRALVEERLLTRGGDGTYIAGPRIFELGSTARAQGQRVRSIGFSYPHDERFFLAELGALLTEAAKIGARVEHRSAHQDGARQIADIAELVSHGVDLILIDPVIADGLEEVFAGARRARVPVVAVGSATTGADAVVATDNTKAGAFAGAALVKALNGRGRVALVQGTAVTANADRVMGFRTELAGSPHLSVVATSRGELDELSGERAAKEILDAEPAIDGFFASNDEIAIGISNVLAVRGLQVPIVSVDGGSRAVEQIQSGGPIIATSAQAPAVLIRTAIELGSDLHAHLGVKRRSIYLPPQLIDATNVQDYEPWQ